MKRTPLIVFAIAFALVMMMTLCACGGSNTNKPSTPANDTPAGEETQALLSTGSSCIGFYEEELYYSSFDSVGGAEADLPEGTKLGVTTANFAIADDGVLFYTEPSQGTSGDYPISLHWSNLDGTEDAVLADDCGWGKFYLCGDQVVYEHLTGYDDEEYDEDDWTTNNYWCLLDPATGESEELVSQDKGFFYVIDANESSLYYTKLDDQGAYANVYRSNLDMSDEVLIHEGDIDSWNSGIDSTGQFVAIDLMQQNAVVYDADGKEVRTIDIKDNADGTLSISLQDHYLYCAGSKGSVTKYDTTADKASDTLEVYSDSDYGVSIDYADDICVIYCTFTDPGEDGDSSNTHLYYQTADGKQTNCGNWFES